MNPLLKPFVNDETLDRALSIKPRVAIPTDFAARVVRQAEYQARPTTNKENDGTRWGKSFAIAAFASMPAIMLLEARMPHGLPAYAVQTALYTQFLVLCVWLPVLVQRRGTLQFRIW